MKKTYLKTKPVCRVTFSLPGDAARNAKTVSLVGDFNRWDPKATPLKKRKDGSYSVTVDLEKGREYEFRYLIDGRTWENDWQADRYVRAPAGDSENSVVST